MWSKEVIQIFNLVIFKEMIKLNLKESIMDGIISLHIKAVVILCATMITTKNMIIF